MALPFTRSSVQEEELQAVREVLESGWITTGPKARAFEKSLSEYLGANLG
jgi:dTDP-4-amino-4,6-dideoxygalactose transaminase